VGLFLLAFVLIQVGNLPWRRGLRYTAVELAVRKPRRIAKRFWDGLYDLRNGVDTAGTIGLAKLQIDKPSAAFGNNYRPTTARSFRKALAALPVRFEDFVFVDLGSGKGKALLLASHYPFQRIVGVEFGAKLVHAAQSNIARYRRQGVQCRSVESVCADATTYDFPPEPGIYYIYNAFFPPVLNAVLENIHRSLNQAPREVYIVYVSPMHRDLFDAMPWLTRLTENSVFCIYRAAARSASAPGSPW
jgi:SAM-dependent methyltransferase